MAISTIGSDGLATSAVTSTKLSSGVPTRAQLPAGTVLQVVQGTYSTETQSSSTSFADTGLTASITPTSASSKILVIVNHSECGKGNGNVNNSIGMNLCRNGSQIQAFTIAGLYTGTTIYNQGYLGFTYLDSPASASAVTYKTQFKNLNATSYVYVQSNNTVATITLMEIAA